MILLRGGERGLEVLLLRRNPAARFMGGAWVFPGGAVDPARGGTARPHRRAAVREVEEEAGLALPDPAALVTFSRWITPRADRDPLRHALLPRRRPAGQEPRADGERDGRPRLVHAGRRARRAPRAASSQLVFPTIKHLEQLPAFASADELLAWATGREVVPVEPRVDRRRGGARRAARRARLCG